MAAARVLVVGLLFAAGAVLVPLSPAAADSVASSCNGYYDAGGDTPCRTDDAYYEFCISSSMPAVWADRAWYAAYWIGNVSDLTSVQTGCNWGTDVAFHLAGYDGINSDAPNILGRYYCVVRSSTSACDHAYALGNPDSPYIYQPAYGDKPYYTYQQMLWNIENMFCHELGHSVGLFHDTGYGGCLVSGFSSTFNGYSTHHINHMNAMY